MTKIDDKWVRSGSGRCDNRRDVLIAVAGRLCCGQRLGTSGLSDRPPAQNHSPPKRATGARQRSQVAWSSLPSARAQRHVSRCRSVTQQIAFSSHDQVVRHADTPQGRVEALRSLAPLHTVRHDNEKIQVAPFAQLATSRPAEGQCAETGPPRRSAGRSPRDTLSCFAWDHLTRRWKPQHATENPLSERPAEAMSTAGWTWLRHRRARADAMIASPRACGAWTACAPGRASLPVFTYSRRGEQRRHLRRRDRG